MGQALVIGVATKLYIHKQERYTQYTKDDIRCIAKDHGLEVADKAGEL